MFLSRSSLNRVCRRHIRSFTVLAFESSADDTAVAIVNSERQILSNVVRKQHALHEGYGGIHPKIAIEAHQRNMPLAVQQALQEARTSVNDIDGIAFTRGPGIGGCLSVGSNAAKSLAAALGKPLVGVHHMQAHALTPLLTCSTEEAPVFPFLTLLVSGGHTLLLVATSRSEFKILGTTLDESIGRTFDKISRLLELKWSNRGPGAALEEFALQTTQQDLESVPALPRPMPKRLAFSFSALHSAVERFVYNQGGIGNIAMSTRRGLAMGFQNSAIAQLEEKLGLGMDWCARENLNIRHVVVSGGVASNQLLRTRLSTFLNNWGDHPICLVYPPVALCTDNAAMIAWAAMYRFLDNDFDDYTIDLRPEWSLENLQLH
ncbi:hypothetical protein HGRIS_002267 [Hohenbuehelia grisea]|uniref:N(6)-L-threonylcarbamoyladenine synthase n=1 Tax=Hohenbuehelia grisea TaxID=104357 RepID=A0ABR3JL42_9AGAR